MVESCSVIFRGDIVLGKNLIDVKQKLMTLFKVDDARIDRMFTGKPVSLKVNISQAQAKKYQAILSQVGIVTTITDSTAVNKAPGHQAPSHPVTSNKAPKAPSASGLKPPISTSTKKVTSATSNTSVAVSLSPTNFSLAPTGSDLVDEKEAVSVTVVDTAHLDLSPQEGNIVRDDERLAPLPATVDLDDLEWDITDVGEVLLQESERREVEPLYVNTDDLSVSDAGALLVEGTTPDLIEEVDISHLTLAPHNPFL